MIVDDHNVKIIIAVTYEDETDSFQQSRISGYRISSGALILFDKGDKNSFNMVEERFHEYKNNIFGRNDPTFIVGIHTESIEVTMEDGKALADKLNTQYIEITKDNKDDVFDLFRNLVRECFKQKCIKSN